MHACAHECKRESVLRCRDTAQACQCRYRYRGGDAHARTPPPMVCALQAGAPAPALVHVAVPRRHAHVHAALRALATALLALANPASAAGTASSGPFGQRRGLREHSLSGSAARGFVEPPSHVEQSLLRLDHNAATTGPTSFKPVRTTEELRAAVGRYDHIGVTQGAVLELCWTVAIPAGTNVTISCQGATLDLRCTGGGITLGRDASLTMDQCNMMWPLQEPFFNAAGPGSARMRLADESLLRLWGASQTLDCDVRTCCACSLLSDCVVLTAGASTHRAHCFISFLAF